MLVFWASTPRGLAGYTNVSEEHTASIFGAEILRGEDSHRD
jgi:hypothetical protein